MRIHSGCTAFSISFEPGEQAMKMRHYLPLQRSDGGKPRSADARGVTITHCPFCGTPFPK